MVAFYTRNVVIIESFCSLVNKVSNGQQWTYVKCVQSKWKANIKEPTK